MKKLIALLLLATGFAFVSCKKEIAPKETVTPPKTETEPVAQQSPTTKLDYFKLLAEKFLVTAKYSADFKEWLYTSCYAERHGDYYVRVKELLDEHVERGYQFWTNEEIDDIQEILNNIREIDINSEENDFTPPIVFIPFVEDINMDSLLAELPAATPGAVISMEYNDATATCPGYTLNDNDELHHLASDINETYAWSHDLWVFGQEEVLDDNIGGRVVNTFPSTGHSHTNRVDGRAENGGIIQVTDLGAIEKWTAGKFEFRYFIYSASGVKIKDKNFPQRKRKNFRNDAWYDFQDFIANWNIANIGNFMVEGWIERDGGFQSNTVSISIPSGCQGCPSMTVSVTKQKADDDLGQSIVQFTDPVQPTDPTTTVYGISYSNFKRKH
jgi:hypothetical protein